ncbi:hypothetical protein F511_45577 [Dorcoceras hygrometricum]|uniref:Uncharacterized protein n=1 Tax=Dorcoceras hygrometricum TaxID=472368 RepID=A0A2Z6ZVJ9_9LAMI|nr:hypothetical protein F511_45577 [Dorcoceras hygrometricum]
MRDDAHEAAAGREGVVRRWCAVADPVDCAALLPLLRTGCTGFSTMAAPLSSCDDGTWSAAHVAAARAFFAARNFCAAACRPPLRRCSGEFPVMS